MQVKRVAACSCGQLSATISGDPIRVSMCHCLKCQQRTGSAFGVQARFLSSQIESIHGESKSYVRGGDDPGEVEFSFCPNCGSTVFWKIDDEEFVIIAAGAFADPHFPGPTRAVYLERKHAWIETPNTVVECFG